MERRFRLRCTNDVQMVYENGRAWKHPLMVLLARPNGLASSRVGVAASRKVGGATVRNRSKRLMREAARHLYAQIDPGWDILLVARKHIVGASGSQVEEALALLIERANLVA
jgi:ribonuclease P protein component